MTYARFKTTPTTINIKNHGQYQTNSPKIYWGKSPMHAFSHQGGTSGRKNVKDCCEKASPLVPRNSGFKGDLKVPGKYRSPHQESPLPASCKRDLASQFQK
jgi:hypothetical protein